MEQHLIKSTEAIEKFIFGGKALFTVKNEKTQNRFTYKIKASKDGKVFFISTFFGCDNESSKNYKFIGTIFDRTKFVIGKKCKVNPEHLSIKGFDWFFRNLRAHTLPTDCGVYHSCKCGRCGRTLTVPESIESGFGPECINLI